MLEIGTGSGYAAAVLARIAGAIHTIERIPGLAEKARATLGRLGYRTARVIHGDGTLGWTLGAPYDAIVVTAQGPPHSALPARAAKARRPPGHASQRGR